MLANSLLTATHTDLIRKKSINKIFNTFCEILFKNTQEIISMSNQKSPQDIFNQLEAFLKRNMITFTSARTEASSFIDEDLGEALYAMCALADEILLNINWDGKKFWESHLLESAFFNTHISGELIFKRIDNLLLEGNALFVDLAEIYLKMLALGFTGKYRGELIAKEIDNYRDKLYLFITSSDSSAVINDMKLFDKEYNNVSMSTIQTFLPTRSPWNNYIISFLRIFFIFGILYWISDTKVIFNRISEIESIAAQDTND